MANDNRKALYEKLSNHPVLSQGSDNYFGSFEDFDKALDDPFNQRSAYEFLTAQGEDLGGFDSFHQSLERDVEAVPEGDAVRSNQAQQSSDTSKQEAVDAIKHGDNERYRQAMSDYANAETERVEVERARQASADNTPVEDLDDVELDKRVSRDLERDVAAAVVDMPTETFDDVMAKYDTARSVVGGRLSVEEERSRRSLGKSVSGGGGVSVSPGSVGKVQAGSVANDAKVDRFNKSVEKYNSFLSGFADVTGRMTSLMEEALSRHSKRYNDRVLGARDSSDAELADAFVSVMESSGYRSEHERAADAAAIVSEMNARERGGHAKTTGEQYADAVIEQIKSAMPSEGARIKESYDTWRSGSYPDEEISPEVYVARAAYNYLDDQLRLFAGSLANEEALRAGQGVKDVGNRREDWDLSTLRSNSYDVKGFDIGKAIEYGLSCYDPDKWTAAILAYAAKEGIDYQTANRKVIQGISDTLVHEFASRMMPGSNTEYALERLLGDNFVSNIAKAIGVNLYGSSSDILSIRDNALGLYSENNQKGAANIATQIGTEVGLFVGDMAIGAFALPELAAGMATRSLVGMTAQGMRSMGGKLVSGMVGGAANFATYELQSEAIRQAYTHDFDLGHLGKSFFGGAAKGAAFGATGNLLNRAFRGTKGWARVGGDVVTYLGESSVFAGFGYLETGTLTMKDIGSAFGMALAPRGKKVLHPGKLVKDISDRFHGRMSGVEDVMVHSISDTQYQALRDKGYSAVARALKGARITESDLSALRDEFDQMRQDKSVSYQTLRMADWVLNGRLLPVYADAKDIHVERDTYGNWIVTLVDGDGRAIVPSVTCKGTEQKERTADAFRHMIEQADYHRSVGKANEMNMERSLATAAAAYAAEKGVGTGLQAYKLYLSAITKLDSASRMGWDFKLEDVLQPEEQAVFEYVGKMISEQGWLESGIETQKKRIEDFYRVKIEDALNKPAYQRSDKEKTALSTWGDYLRGYCDYNKFTFDEAWFDGWVDGSRLPKPKEVKVEAETGGEQGQDDAGVTPKPEGTPVVTETPPPFTPKPEESESGGLSSSDFEEIPSRPEFPEGSGEPVGKSDLEAVFGEERLRDKTEDEIAELSASIEYDRQQAHAFVNGQSNEPAYLQEYWEQRDKIGRFSEPVEPEVRQEPEQGQADIHTLEGLLGVSEAELRSSYSEAELSQLVSEAEANRQAAHAYAKGELSARPKDWDYWKAHEGLEEPVRASEPAPKPEPAPTSPTEATPEPASEQPAEPRSEPLPRPEIPDVKPEDMTDEAIAAEIQALSGYLNDANTPYAPDLIERRHALYNEQDRRNNAPAEETEQDSGQTDLKKEPTSINQDGNGGVDNQGNRLNSDGSLYVESVSDINELTDTDFEEPTRSVVLVGVPQNIRNAIGADEKPIIIKKNIFGRNSIAHADLTPQQSREILQATLFNGDLYGQNQKVRNPFNWVVINTTGKDGRNRLVLLEVNQGKDNVEIVHWHFIDKRGLEKLRRQAAREDGQLLILPSEGSEEVGALSDPTRGTSSADKGNEKVPDGQKDSDNSDNVPPETPPDGGGVPVGEPAAAEVGDPAAESASAAAVPRVDPESGIPLRNRGKDRNGNLRLVPNWERATAEQIYTYLSHESRRDTMQGTIDEQVRKARAEVKRVEKSEPKGKKRTERAKTAWERELEKAQAQLRKWEEVRQEQVRDLKAQTEANETDFREVKNRNKLWEYLRDKDFLDLYDYVARALAGSVKFRWLSKGEKRAGGREKNKTMGLGGHLGMSDSAAERRQRAAFIDERGGVWPEDYAHKLWEELPTGMREQYSEADVFDMVLDIMRSNPNRLSLLQESASRHQERPIEAEDADLDKAWEEYYGDEVAEQDHFYDEAAAREADRDAAAAAMDADYMARLDYAREVLSNPASSEFERQAARAVLGASGENADADSADSRVRPSRSGDSAGKTELPKGADAGAELVDPSALPGSETLDTWRKAWGEVSRAEVVRRHGDGTADVRLWFADRNQRGIDLRGVRLGDGETRGRVAGGEAERPSGLSAEENERRVPLRARAEASARSFGVPIRVCETIDDVRDDGARRMLEQLERSGSSERLPGWFNTATGEVEIYLPHVVDSREGERSVSAMEELDRTIVHEVVAHRGLRALLRGKGGDMRSYNDLLDDIWARMPVEERDRWRGYAGVSDSASPHRAAVDEYIAHIAEGVRRGLGVGEFERSVWRRFCAGVRRMLRAALRPMGLDLRWSENDIADLVVRSARNLRRGAADGVSSGSGLRSEGTEGENRLAVRRGKRDGGDYTRSLFDEVVDRSVPRSLKEELGSMTDKELLRRIGEDSMGTKTFYSEEYDRRHQKEYNELCDSYRKMLEDNNTNEEDASGMLLRAIRDWRDGHAGSERTRLRAQFDTLNDYYAEKEQERLDREGLSPQSEEGVTAEILTRSSFDPTQIGLRELENGESCYVQRRYEQSGMFDFTGSEHIESGDDVAHIFRKLQDSAIENTFLVLIKDGHPTILHIGMGDYSMSVAHIGAGILAASALKPDRVFLVHNHPSGSLEPSSADVGLLNRTKALFGEDVVGDGIIIDTTRGEFSRFIGDGTSMVSAMRSATATSEIPYEVYTFSRLVFSPDWNPNTAFQCSSPEDVASFISSHRLGEHSKVSLLVLDRQKRLTANIFLPWTDLTKVPAAEVASVVSRYVHQMGGSGAILVGNANPGGTVRDVKEHMKANQTVLVDYIDVEHGGYRSYLNSGELNEQGVNYGGNPDMRFRFVGERGAVNRDAADESENRYAVRGLYSNAERAVERVKQEKAKAEQWLSMLRNSGGLKSGEDKWMGLSQWLDEHKGETLTREQVLDFVRENGIEMRETTYQNAVMHPSIPEKVYDDFEDYYDRWTDEDFETPGDHLEYAWEAYCNVSPRWIRESIEPHLYRDGTWDLRISDINILREQAGINSDYAINRGRLHYTTEGLENKREIAFVVDGVEPYQEDDAIHFGPENGGRAVMWVRFGEATDADGKRVLVIDEVQSNRHQDAREKGYRKSIEDYRNSGYRVERNSSNNGNLIYDKDGNFIELVYDNERPQGVPAAPFERNWHEVVMKRMLRLAADEGFDKVAWTTGAQQAERYGIGGVVERITKGKTRGENTLVSVQYRNGKEDSWVVAPDGKVVGGGITTGENLSDLIGKELSEKVMSLEENGSISGDGLRIGGDGMKAFYDGILPSFMKKYVKKWGSGVGEVKLTTPGGEVMHSVDVTDSMRESVRGEGQTLFRLTGAERERVERDNERFNSELDKQIRGELPSGHVYKMGIPSSILRSAGFPEQEIELAAKRLTDKSAQHGFNIGDVRDLAAALQEPVAVFSYGDKGKAQNVIVEIMRDGRNFVVGVHFNQRHDHIEVSSIRGLFPKENAEWLNWITQGKMLYVDKEKIQTIIDQQRTTPADVDYLDLDSAAKIVENFENPAIDGEKVSKTTEIGETRPAVRAGIEGVIHGDVPALGAENKRLRDERKAAVRAVTSLRGAMSKQRAYDRGTVKLVTDLASDLMARGLLDRMSNVEVGSLLRRVRNSAGREDVTKEVNRLVDLVIDHQVKSLSGDFADLVGTKVTKKNSSGVIVQGSGDDALADTMEALRDGLSLPSADLDSAISDADAARSDVSKTAFERKLAESRFDGLSTARLYQSSVGRLEGELGTLRLMQNANAQSRGVVAKELKQARADLSSGVITQAEYDARETALKQRQKLLYQERDALEAQVRANKLDRIESLENMVDAVSSRISSGRDAARDFVSRQRERADEIRHHANSDLEGVSNASQQKVAWQNRAMHLSLPQYTLSTFSDLLKFFGRKHARGEGYLFRDFMHLARVSTQNYERGLKSGYDRLSAKAAEVLGKDKAKWADFVDWVHSLPSIVVDFIDGGVPNPSDGKLPLTPHTLTQGQAAYIYAVNKMSDGVMKLRRMGIDEDAVNAIKGQLDPKVVEVIDWLQEDFLPGTRTKYDEVHRRLFGAPLRKIENYFHLNILDMELGAAETGTSPGGSPGASGTTTGSIIDRTVNTKALDLRSDAFEVVVDELRKMEHWAAYGELSRDVNTLLNYKNFKAKVHNMYSTRFGSGKDIWRSFVDCCHIVTGSFEPSRSVGDATMMNAAKLVSTAKVSMRLFTASKQLLSWAAFLPDVRTEEFAKAWATPASSWNWAVANLPGFVLRWAGRTSGDFILETTNNDWAIFRSKGYQKLARLGLTPNAFVDAVTVATGAKAVYESRLRKYKRMGYSDSAAHERALDDAYVAYNSTQQSSDGAFMSPLQAERTVISAALSVFRSASMGYGRRLYGAAANLGRKLTTNPKEMISYMAKQFERDGLSAADAERAAKRAYAMSYYHDIAEIAVFSVGMQLLWNLGSDMIYLAFGNDDTDDNATKKEIILDHAVHAVDGGWAEGFAGGNLISEGLHRYVRGDDSNTYGRGGFLEETLPLFSDAHKMLRKATNGEKDAEAATDIVNMIVQSGFGVNPETVTDIFVAALDAADGDFGVAKETGLFLMRFGQVPRRQQEQFLLGAIGTATDSDGNPLTAQQIAERYARYRRRQQAPFFGALYGDEKKREIEDGFVKQFLDKERERMSRMSDEQLRAYAEYAGGDNIVKEVYSRAGVDAPGKSDTKASVAYSSVRNYDDIIEDAALKRRGSDYDDLLERFRSYGGGFSKGKLTTRKGFDRDRLHRLWQEHGDELRALALLELWKKDSSALKKKLADGADSESVMKEYRTKRKKILEKTEVLSVKSSVAPSSTGGD